MKLSASVAEAISEQVGRIKLEIVALMERVSLDVRGEAKLLDVLEEMDELRERVAALEEAARKLATRLAVKSLDRLGDTRH